MVSSGTDIQLLSTTLQTPPPRTPLLPHTHFPTTTHILEARLDKT